nr:D-Ala-D-Ala carboxypeptidase family metallohydrolase [Moraxella sp. CTOTU46934]
MIHQNKTKNKPSIIEDNAQTAQYAKPESANTKNINTTKTQNTKTKILTGIVGSGTIMTLLIACNHPVTPVDNRKPTTPIVRQTQPNPKNTTVTQTDNMRGLILNRQNTTRPTIDYGALKNTTRYNSSIVYTNDADFKDWLASHSYQQSEVLAYQNYLQSQLGSIPPMDQLITSARDARRCGFEPYEVPPASLWQNIVPTLQMLQQLQKQGYLPYSTVIRSVYRNPVLNDCAGGAGESKHMTNGGIDIWVPENEANKWAIESTFDGLCQFWQSNGQAYSFGLGLYPTGSVHLDTQGFRKWGASHSSSSSPCRF